MEPDVRTYLEKYFPGKTGVGVRRPTGRKFRQMSGLTDKLKLVVGHSFIERMAKAEKTVEGDNLIVGWIGYSGATMEQILTAVYQSLDGEFRYLEAEIIVYGWENSIMNGMSEKEAEMILDGVVAEQQGDHPYRIFIAECVISPALIKAGKSAVVFRVNRLVKAVNKRLGAHSMDVERSIGKVVTGRELVGLKKGMWEGEGREAYHPNEVGSSRMASWLREYLRHGTNVMDPDYPPKGFRKRETVGPGPRGRTEKTPQVLVPPYWGRTKEKEERVVRMRESRRREKSEPPRGRSRTVTKTTSRSSSVDSECRMDSTEEREVDNRARVAVESDDGGQEDEGHRVVRDLITLEEDDDPLEGTSRRFGGSETGGPSSSQTLGEAESGGSPVSPTRRAEGEASRKRRREILLEANMEDVEALEEHWQTGKTLLFGVFGARKRMLEAKDRRSVNRARRDVARKRDMLDEHLAGLRRLALKATEFSDSEDSSSSSSSEDEDTQEVERVTKRLKSVREASSRPLRK